MLSDHGVLMLAEQLGGARQLGGEPRDARPTGLNEGIDRVARTLGQDAHAVPLSAVGIEVHAPHLSHQPLPGLLRKRGQHLDRGLVRGVGHRGSSHRGDEVVEQPGVTVAAQCREGARPRCCKASAQHLVDRRSGRLGIGVGEQCRVRVKALLHDLGVADGAELVGHPAQLLAQRLGPVRFEEWREGAQHAAQSSGRDAHLVHGVGQVAAHADVGEDETASVLGERRGERVNGEATALGDDELGHVGRLPGPRTEGPRGLAQRTRLGAGLEQCCGDGIEQLLGSRMLVVDDLDLDLAEAGHRLVAQVAHLDGIVDDLEHRPLVRVYDGAGSPMGAHGCDRHECCVTDERGHDVGERRGHLAGRRDRQR